MRKPEPGLTPRLGLQKNNEIDCNDSSRGGTVKNALTVLSASFRLLDMIPRSPPSE